jgi:DNA-binding MarR family transcriptional regulator
MNRNDEPRKQNGSFAMNAVKSVYDHNDFHTMPGHLIRRAQQISVAIFIDECMAQNITPVQFACLAEVARNPGIDATRLASQIALDRSTLGTVIERLETKGLIARMTGPEDRRTKLLHLTGAGGRLLAEIQPAVVRAQEKLLGPLTASEQATFMRLLSKLVDLNNESSRAPMGARKAENAA